MEPRFVLALCVFWRCQTVRGCESLHFTVTGIRFPHILCEKLFCYNPFIAPRTRRYIRPVVPGQLLSYISPRVVENQSCFPPHPLPGGVVQLEWCSLPPSNLVMFSYARGSLCRVLVTARALPVLPPFCSPRLLTLPCIPSVRDPFSAHSSPTW